MKYALVFAMLGIAVWFWRAQRLNRKNASSSQAKGASSIKSAVLGRATKMVACRVCQLHLPSQDALPGQNGVYCSEAHKQVAGD